MQLTEGTGVLDCDVWIVHCPWVGGRPTIYLLEDRPYP